MKKQGPTRSKKTSPIESLTEPLPRAGSKSGGKAQQQPFPLPTIAAKAYQDRDRALQRFFCDAPRAEVARFRQLYEAVQQNNQPQEVVNKLRTEEWLWETSILLWDAYQDGNKAHVLERLHDVLAVNEAFFRRQWWVAELIAAWQRDQDLKKIDRLFKGRRGKRHPQRKAEMLRRNQQIVATVEKHLLDYHYMEAIRRAHAELKPLGLTDMISEKNVISVYEKTFLLGQMGRYRSIDLAVKEVRACGYSQEEAEQKIASHPGQCRISEPLSFELVHSICKKYKQLFSRSAHHPRSAAGKS